LPNFRSVEIRKVKGGQRRAIREHAAHVGDLGGIEVFKPFYGSEHL